MTSLVFFVSFEVAFRFLDGVMKQLYPHDIRFTSEAFNVSGMNFQYIGIIQQKEKTVHTSAPSIVLRYKKRTSFITALIRFSFSTSSEKS